MRILTSYYETDFIEMEVEWTFLWFKWIRKYNFYNYNKTPSKQVYFRIGKKGNLILPTVWEESVVRKLYKII